MLQRARASGFRGDEGAEGAETTMRGKRQRQAAARAAGSAASNEAAADEHLLHMDPSLMTERQQLAFLLRTTAQEASASESPHSEDDATGDERRPARKKARRAAAPREPSRSRDGDLHRGRGRLSRSATGARPAKAHVKVASRTSPRTSRSKPAFDGFPSLDGGDRRKPKDEAEAATHDENENVASAGNVKKEATSPAFTGGHDLRSGKKQQSQRLAMPPAATSPSSSSDVVLMKASPFGRATGADDTFGAVRTCALCGGAPFSDALFLCPACDLKYPTQQALGRMCMT